MDNLPTNLLTKILEHTTTNTPRTAVLDYRFVTRKWKLLMDSVIEKKILSGEYAPFPEIKKEASALANPFPFNSAALTKTYEFSTDNLLLGCILASRAPHLTSLSLQNQPVGPSFLTSLLGQLPALKLLSLSFLKFNHDLYKPGTAVLPRPPPLPSLTILELKLRPDFHQEQLLLYTWLICSFADQLACLRLWIDRQFPALQQNHSYSQSLFGHMLHLGTTSGSAFTNLEELSLAGQSLEFLRQSETPSLRRLSLADKTNRNFGFDVKELVNFLLKCRDTLENLSLDIFWQDLTGLDVLPVLDEGGRPKRLGLPVGATFPVVKKLTIHFYPAEDCQELLFSSEFLSIFPELETLHLILPPKPNYQTQTRVESGNQVLISDHKESLDQVQRDIARKIIVHQQQFHAMGQMDVDAIVSLETLNRDWRAACSEKARIIRRLRELGENVDKVVVEQLMERQKIWGSCSNLRIVSVTFPGEEGAFSFSRPGAGGR